MTTGGQGVPAVGGIAPMGARLAGLRDGGRKLLAAYLVGLDPDPGTSDAMFLEAERAGADILEIGVPFTDPMADGHAIVRGHYRALPHCPRGLESIHQQVRRLRSKGCEAPILLMGYANSFGGGAGSWDGAAEASAAAGVDAWLLVDLPVEDSQGAVRACRDHGLANVFLLAPTTGPERCKAIVEHCSGFVYCVAYKGVTGRFRAQAKEVGQRAAEASRWARVPVLVGFGVRDAETAKAVAAVADGAVVGTALVELAETLDNRELVGAVGARVREIRRALDELGGPRASQAG